MRAAIYAAAGGTEVIEFREVPTPEPGPHQIRLRVHAAGLNRADLVQRRGHYPAPPGWPADIPGLECAGAVDAVGPGVTRWRVGDSAMALVGGGAHAEAVVLHEEEALPVPDGVSLVAAAAIPEAFLTAYDALVTRARLRAGERVLIHAVGSGIGTAATQIAKRIGATTLGTSRTPAKLAQAREYGLDIGIDTSSLPFRSQVTEPVDVVLDVLGGRALADNLDLLASRGRLVLLGLLQGARAEADLNVIMRKRLEVIGSVMRTRGPEERRQLAREFREQLLPLFSAGRRDGPKGLPDGRGTAGPPPLRPVVGTTYPMLELARAHAAMERDETFGKVVLIW
jgi:NADPH2:quinone reductase